MPYEIPEDARTARRTRIWRWVSFLFAALLVAMLAYLGYVGYEGSSQLIDPRGPATDCRTPAALGWEYEAINYDSTGDATLADQPDPMHCSRQGAPAGTELTAADGARIAGWYVPSAAASGPTGPTVVLAHGHGSNKSEMLAHAEALHANFNLVLFDFRNHGQSQTWQTTAGFLEQQDLSAVLDWLTTTKAPTAIALLGVSMGGAAAVNVAADDSDVDALILDSTHATLANALQARLDRVGYPLSLPGAWSILLGGLIRTGLDMSAVDPVQVVERYDGPLLVIAGGRDDAIGRRDADDMVAAAVAGGSQVELHVCAEAGHGGAIVTCAAEYGDWVLGFLRPTLAPAS